MGTRPVLGHARGQLRRRWRASKGLLQSQLENQLSAARQVTIIQPNQEYD